VSAHSARLIEFAPGEIVCRQGARADRAFVLRAGALRSTVLPERELPADDKRMAAAPATAQHAQAGVLLGCEGVLAGHYVDTLVADQPATLVEMPLDTPGVMSAIAEDVAFGLGLARSLARRLVAANRKLNGAQRLAGRFTRELQGLCTDYYNLVQNLGDESAGNDALIQALNIAKRSETHALGEAGGAEAVRQTRRIMAKAVESSDLVGTRVHLKEGDLLCRRGDAGDTVYVLVSGRLSVRIGAEQFGVIRPGEIVGEIGALLGDEEPRRVADVVADESCVVGAIPVSRFPALVQKQPKLLVNLCKLLTLRVKSFEQLAVESKGALDAVAEKYAPVRAPFTADAGVLRRSLEALIAEQSLSLQADVALLAALEERWQQKVTELQARVEGGRKT